MFDLVDESFDLERGDARDLLLKRGEVLPTVPLMEVDLQEAARDESGADEDRRDEKVMTDQAPAGVTG